MTGTLPGLGGQQQAPINSAAGQATPIGVQPGVSTAIVRANKVIVSGAGEGVFVYNGTAGAGTLLTSIVSVTGTDQYGNAVLQGTTSYITVGGTSYAVNLNGGSLNWYSASSEAGPYTLLGGIGVSEADNSLFLIDFGSIGGVLNAPQPRPGGTLSEITVATPTSFSSGWFANVDGVVNALVTQVNELVQTTIPTSGLTN